MYYSPQAYGLLCSFFFAAGALLGACFNPTTQEGLPCSSSGACPSGQSCTSGTCYRIGNAPVADATIDATIYDCTSQTLATGQGGATALDAQDASSVFWTATGGTVVLRSPKVAGDLEVFHDSGLGKTPFGVVTDDTNVFWTENDVGGRVMVKSKASAEIDLATELAINQDQPTYMAVDANSVYWSNATGIMRVAKAGGAITIVASAQDLPRAMVVDDTRVYWINSGSRQIMRCNKGGTNEEVQQLAGAQGDASDIAISEGTVYWSVTEDNEIRSVGKGGGAVSTFVSNQAGVLDLTIAGGFVYWSNKGSGDVMRMAFGGSMPELVVADQSEALSLDFAESLYWLNSTDTDNRLVRASCNSL